MFSKQGERRKRQIVSETLNYINKVSGGGEPKKLIQEIKNQLMNKKRLKKSISEILEENIQFLFLNSVFEFPRTKVATILTRNLNLKKAEDLTFISQSSLSLERNKITINFEEELTLDGDQVEAFSEKILEAAPVRSGTLKERRLIYNTYISFYHDFYLPWTKENNFEPKSITTVVKWIRDLKIKKEQI